MIMNGYAGVMDLSKAFGFIKEGFSKEGLTLIASYLSNRWQHVKINDTFSPWSALEQGVPQGSVLDPVLCYF